MTKKKSKEIQKGPDEDPKSESDKILDLTGLLQRVQADFDNYKKRVEQQQGEVKNRANADIIAKILPILDSFELAIKSDKQDTKGLELIYGQLFGVLESMGLRIMEQAVKLDPFRHEVLMQEESKSEPGTIMEVLQKGYMLNEMVLRTAKVKVAKKAPIQDVK